MKTPKDISDSEKIDYLIKKIDQIERQLNPPFWKKLISWTFNHFWTLLFLVILAYFLFQIWEMVQALQTGVDSLKIQVESFRISVGEKFEVVGEGFRSITEFDASKLQFWK